MLSAKSMKDLEKSKAEKVAVTDKYNEEATRVANDIDEVYKTLDSLPDGLDKEISVQLTEAKEAAKMEAGKDGDELKAAQEKTNKEFLKVCELVEKKMRDNGMAIEKLKGIKAKYGMLDREKAITTISENTALGEQVVSDSKEAMKKSDKALENMRNKINGN